MKGEHPFKCNRFRNSGKAKSKLVVSKKCHVIIARMIGKITVCKDNKRKQEKHVSPWWWTFHI